VRATVPRPIAWFALLLIGGLIAVAGGFDPGVRIALAQSTPPPRDTPTPNGAPTQELTPARNTPTPLATPTSNLTPVRSTPTSGAPPRGTPTSAATSLPGSPPGSTSVPAQAQATATPTTVLLPISGDNANATGNHLALLAALSLGMGCLALGRLVARRRTTR